MELGLEIGISAVRYGVPTEIGPGVKARVATEDLRIRTLSEEVQLLYVDSSRR